MKKINNKVIFLQIFALLLTFSFSLYFTRSTEAAVLMTNGYVRFDRMQAGYASKVGGLVCMKPSTTHTTSATNVKVTFPTGYTLSATASDFNATVTNLPSGAVAMPGIAAATPTVLSQAVTYTFSGNQTLTGATMYCFNFGAGITLPAGQASDQQGQLDITDTVAAIDETITYSTAVVTGDQITITASVPPTFSFSLGGASVNLSTLSTGSVATGNILATVTTNAKTGWMAWVKDSTGGTLHSTNATADVTIPGKSYPTKYNLKSSASSPTTGFGMDVDTGSGTPTIDTAYDGTNADDQVGVLTSDYFKLVASKNTPGSSDTFTMNFKARLAGTEPAASDYGDVVTVTAAGQF